MASSVTLLGLLGGNHNDEQRWTGTNFLTYTLHPLGFPIRSHSSAARGLTYSALVLDGGLSCRTSAAGAPWCCVFSKALLSRRAGLMGDVLLSIQSSLEVHSRCRHRPRNPYSLASYHRTQFLSWWLHSPNYDETHLRSLCVSTQAVLFVPRFSPICPPAIFGSENCLITSSTLTGKCGGVIWCPLPNKRPS